MTKEVRIPNKTERAIMRKKAIHKNIVHRRDRWFKSGYLNAVYDLELDMNVVATKGFIEIQDIWDWVEAKKKMAKMI